jgi:hypothetical protein
MLIDINKHPFLIIGINNSEVVDFNIFKSVGFLTGFALKTPLFCGLCII